MTKQELLGVAKPILFNTEMVRAILDGRKTATRRVIKPQPIDGIMTQAGFLECENPRVYNGVVWGNNGVLRKSKYQVGDILYVRETFLQASYCGTNKNVSYLYKADLDNNVQIGNKWHPSIHMPKEAARIFLKVTDVRVERLQDITSEQVDKEGCKEYGYSVNTGELTPSSSLTFSIRWDDTINKQDLDQYGWNANPWVWVTEFERVRVDE